MTDEVKPDTDEPRPIREDDRNAPPWIAYILAALWIILPAVQYAGAYERTAAATGRDGTVGALGTADLTPWYIVLVGITALYVLVHKSITRSNPDGKQE